MGKCIINSFIFIFLISVLFSTYVYAFKTAGSNNTKKNESQAEMKKAYTPTSQEAGSLKVFSEILDVIESTRDRKSILPKIEELYDKIISEYPDAPLAQESYWKLITLYIEDYSPPAYDKAEARYNEFIKKYPKSALKGFLSEELGRSYYRNAMWKKLLEVCTPLFREHIEQGTRTRASLLFMYAEANYNLGNVAEAEKGYEIVVEKFPKLNEGVKSKSRLKTRSGL